MAHDFGARSEDELLLLCARTMVDGEQAARMQELLAQQLDWEYLVQMARHHGVVSLVYRSLRGHTDQVPESWLMAIKASYRQAAKASLLLTGELLEVLELFAAHGIPAIPLKGPVLATLAYGDVALRQFGDLDILVRPEDVARAKMLLVARGYHRDPLLPDWQEPLHLRTHYVSTLVQNRNHIVVELHQRCRPRYFAFSLDTNGLWERLVSVNVAGRPVSSLSVEDTLLFLCAHGANHWWERLAWICDIAELMRSQPNIDWKEVRARARALGAERMVLLGLLLAHDLLGADMPDIFRQAVDNDRKLVSLAAYVQERLFQNPGEAPGLYAGTHFHLSARERWLDRVRYCLGVAAVTTSEDWSLVRLPASLSFVYSLIRPFRLLGTYGLRPLRRRLTHTISSAE
jgi:hypothetical protein